MTPDAVDGGEQEPRYAEAETAWSPPPPPPETSYKAPPRWMRRWTRMAATRRQPRPETPSASLCRRRMSPGALETMARRNNYLTDRVEKLLDVIEANGAADPSVVMKAISSSTPPATLTKRRPGRGGSGGRGGGGGGGGGGRRGGGRDGCGGGFHHRGQTWSRRRARASVEVCVMQHPGALCCTGPGCDG